MDTVTFKGQPMHIIGSLPDLGTIAPDFELDAQDLSMVTLESFGRKKKLLNIFISLDTPVCSTSIHTFLQQTQSIPNLFVLNISMDLPFAASRFCKASNLENVITLSAFRSPFPDDYGVRIIDGPLEGLCARAVFVLDEDNKILYSELIQEITQEPNYQKALASISVSSTRKE